MLSEAMKGHSPSVEATQDLESLLELARELHQEAVAEAEEGDVRRAQAKLAAANYLVDQVQEASRR